MLQPFFPLLDKCFFWNWLAKCCYCIP